MTTSLPHLRLLPSATAGDQSSTSADPTEASVRVDGQDREPGVVLRRRYTVTVRDDGTEWVDEIEEWEE